MSVKQFHSNAQATVLLEDFVLLRQPTTGLLRRNTEKWSVIGPQRKTWWQTKESSHLTGSYGRSWSEKHVHAGTFSLFGLGCSHAPTPECHSCQISAEHRRPYSYRSTVFGWHGQILHFQQKRQSTYRKLGIRQSQQQSFRDFWTMTSTDWQTRLDWELWLLHTAYSGYWLHVLPIAAVGLRLSDEEITYSKLPPWMCNMSATLLCLQCNGRQNGSAWTFLQEKYTLTHTPCSIKRYYLESSKKSSIFVRNVASGSIMVRRQKTRRSHSHTLDERQAACGRYKKSHRHACHFVRWWHDNKSGSRRPSSFKQDDQVHRAFRDPPLQLQLRSMGWLMEWLGLKSSSAS